MFKKLLNRFRKDEIQEQNVAEFTELSEISEAEALELIDEYKSKKSLSAREELILEVVSDVHVNKNKRSKPSKVESVEIIKKEDGLFTFQMSDHERHEPRNQSIALNDYDRVFWLNIIIACDGPDVDKGSYSQEENKTKNFGTLDNAKNDLKAFLQFYTPTRLGAPNLVYKYKLGRSAGYFDKTIELDNPSSQEVIDAVELGKLWVKNNVNDPEFLSIQINFFFSGHGFNNSEESGIVISDGDFSSAAIAESILSCLPSSEDCKSPCRLDLFLDCCHSGAVARDIMDYIYNIQEPEEKLTRKHAKLGFGKIFCSCLDDESSIELSDLNHGLFTFTFLNEFSRKSLISSKENKIGLRDVGWYSDLQQHPFMVDYTSSDSGLGMVKFPSMKLLNDKIKTELFNNAFEKQFNKVLESNDFKVVDGETVVNPLEITLGALRELRVACYSQETAIREKPSIRKAFSRKEHKNHELKWF
ncbi:hypothetical protein tinsulaeT_10690 [Thalassotalea insulae]|uniref:Peptidase C14 caspase domain-containing protein n=1 Tax=Thalassotalea insulae TaxID=2056778 RepID=A0ABQ6GQ31_9GAMM|nr:caspase family protein [Thalassotalea insulae]GLX77729.1 hypothetical protein tinsulaeT_10690 [Thalassotalea insulae]